MATTARRHPVAPAPVRGVAELTPAWCEAALAPHLDGASVVALSCEAVGTGQLADTVRLRLETEPAGAGPGTLIAKVPSSSETSRAAAALMRTYEIEAAFYRDLAPTLPVRTPRCWFAACDPERETAAVLLEDVADGRQGDQLAGCTADEMAAAVGELVALHAPRWGDPALAALDWLARGTPESLAGTAALVESVLAGFLERYAGVLDAEVAALVERLAGRIGALLAPSEGPRTVVHGDFRADNLLFDVGRPVVIDWQTVGLGPGPADLAYLLGASFTVADRRAHERDLVRDYAERLAAAGVETTEDDVLAGYRRHASSGLVMAIGASQLVERTERGDAMFATMADRHGRQMLDLGTEELVR